MKNDATVPQKMPVDRNGEIILDKVIQDLKGRSVKGEKKYGMKLRTGNGRNALLDAYQEALDLTMYLAQAIMEQDKGDL